MPFLPIEHDSSQQVDFCEDSWNIFWHCVHGNLLQRDYRESNSDIGKISIPCFMLQETEQLRSRNKVDEKHIRRPPSFSQNDGLDENRFNKFVALARYSHCFNTYTARPVCLSGWISDSYCSLKPLCSGMGEVVPTRTSPTLLPPSPRTVLSLSCFKVSQCINCRDWHYKSYCVILLQQNHSVHMYRWSTFGFSYCKNITFAGSSWVMILPCLKENIVANKNATKLKLLVDIVNAW